MSSSSEFSVASSDIIQLILGYLTAQGLHQSAQTLRRESGVGLKGLVHPGLPDQIRQGDWGTVLKALTLSQESFPSVQEQVILELASEATADSLSLAHSVLKVHREELDQLMEPLQDDSLDGAMQEISKARALEQRLAAIAGNPRKYSTKMEREALLFGSKVSSSRQESRNRLAKDVDCLPLVPLNRLPLLLQQAMKWQAHTGQLPWIKKAIEDPNPSSSDSNQRKKRKKRKRLDLVMGVASGGTFSAVVGEPLMQQEDDDAEPIPSEIHATVKFGKSAVCESAILFQKGLITGSSDGLIEVWDASYKDLNSHDFPFQKDSAMGHTDTRILCLDLSNDHELLSSGDAEGNVKVWKLSSGKCLRQFQAHANQPVTALAFSRDSSRLLSGSASGTCREFGLVTQHILQEYGGHSSYVHTCQYILLEGSISYIITGSADGTARLWQNGNCLRIFQPHANPNVSESIVVDQTKIQAENPAIHTILSVPGTANLVIVSRASVAYMIDSEGTILQKFQADSADVDFSAAAISSSWLFLSSSKDCLVFSLKTGDLRQTIRDFTADSVGKATAPRTSEITQLLHHPCKPILAAFSNDKSQKKGILTVWK